VDFSAACPGNENAGSVACNERFARLAESPNVPASPSEPVRFDMSSVQKCTRSADLLSNRALALGVVALTIAGFVLRLLCARGGLWLDEIWSIQNLQSISNVGQIFWGISQDNNHVLNSLWLWFVGPDAAPILIRLEAVVLGSLTIPIAAKFCARSGPAAALGGAALVAGSAIFVHYGSEARGYAGLILMIFIAAEVLENFLEEPANHRSRLVFGAAVAFGALFHLTMLTAAFTLIVATLARIYFRSRSPRGVASAAIDLAIPAALGSLPALGFLVAGVLTTHKIQLGDQVPFTFARLARGLATLYEATLGLPYGLPLWLAAAVAIILTGASLFLIPPERRILPLACLLLPPFAAILVQMPNVHIARFHLIGAVGLVVLFADVMARLWTARQAAFALAIGLGLAIGNGLHIAQLLALGRGDYEQFIARMERAGPATYASNMPAEVGRTVRFYDARLGRRLTQVATSCQTPPDWFILSDDPAGEAARRSFGPPHCAAPFKLDMVMQPAPLSGLRLALYRRAKS